MVLSVITLAHGAKIPMLFSIVVVVVVVIELTGRVDYDYDNDNGQERCRCFCLGALGQDIEQLATGHQG
jgi:hypothetical protein